MAEKSKSLVAKAAKYYVVNPLGVVHPAASREHAQALIKQPGFRMATKAEIAALAKLEGVQSPKRTAGKAQTAVVEAAEEEPHEEPKG